MSGAALVAGGVLGAWGAAIALLALGLCRAAAHADRVALAHEQRAQAADGAPPRTTSQGIAAMDAQIGEARAALLLQPESEWWREHLDQLLDRRLSLMAAAATTPRSRVVRHAATTP